MIRIISNKLNKSMKQYRLSEQLTESKHFGNISEQNKNPLQMPRKIPSQNLRSEKYDTRLNNVDANMTAYLLANYENDICDNLIELWERDRKKSEEKSIKMFYGKEEWYLNNAF